MTLGGPALTPGGSAVAHDRVTDETARMRMLMPGDPAFRVPNRISRCIGG